MREKQRESEDPSWWVCNGLKAGMRSNATVCQTVNMSVITDHPTQWVAKKVLVLDSDFENREKGR